MNKKLLCWLIGLTLAFGLVLTGCPNPSSDPEPEPAPTPEPERPVIVEGAYYLAPDGDDAAGDGTIEKPWFTFKKVQSVVRAGDTVYLRGGRYMIDDTTSDQVVQGSGGSYGTGTAAILFYKSGLPGKPITYTAYPLDDERPVLDLSGRTTFTGVPTGITIGLGTTNRADYIVLKGFDITGLQGTTTSGAGNTIWIPGGSYNTLENLRMYENAGTGIFMTNSQICAYNLIKNCDAFNNRNPLNPNANGSIDGFGTHLAVGSVGNVLYGCRAWVNGDDGFDSISCAEQVIIDHCWSAYNGYYYDTAKIAVTDPDNPPNLDTSLMIRADNGLGIKTGGFDMGTNPTRAPTIIPNQVVRYSLTVGNPHSGFSENHGLAGVYYYNNTAYNNNVNFEFVARHLPNDVGPTNRNATGVIVKNNVAFAGPRTGVWEYMPPTNAQPWRPCIDDIGWWTGITDYHVTWLDIESGLIENNSFSVVDNGAKNTHAHTRWYRWSGWDGHKHTGGDDDGEYVAAQVTAPTNPEDRAKDIVQNALNLNDTHFISLDENLFLTPRKADGSLPDIDLARPASGSPAANIGYTAPDTNADGLGNAWKVAGAVPVL